MIREGIEKFGGEREFSPEELEVAAESIPSEKHPEINEDAYFTDEKHRLFGVFDGMGGHAAGEIASSLARDCVLRRSKELRDKPSLEETVEAMRSALLEANEEIVKVTETDLMKRGMGTTASVVQIWGEGASRQAVIGNVGDSRVYRLTKDGALEEITLDDSLFSKESDEDEARSLQKKLSEAKSLDDLNEIETVYWRRRNTISQALGLEHTRPRVETIGVSSGDRILITSDGIHDNLTDNEIQRILEENPESKSAAHALIKATKNTSTTEDFRSKKDDMTAVVVNL